MDLSQKIYFCPWLLNFFENLIWVYEPLINSWFNVPIAQIFIFILFVSASVLFEGIFSLWESINQIFYCHCCLFKRNETKSRGRLKPLRTEPIRISKPPDSFTGHESCDSGNINFWNCHVTSSPSRDQRALWVSGWEPLTVSQRLA